MKKSVVFTLLLLLLNPASISVSAQPKECPELDKLEDTSIKDKNDVVNALKTLIPETYEVGIYPDIYSQWKVLSALPFLNVGGNEEEENYYGMAKNFCGKRIADKSWLVRLEFPLSKGASSSQGQIFLAKSKKQGWFVWFRYH
ncbi:hypothetical protein [Metabacillus dongyingensis]|uniref:hypothetical protein n=1 Tax=Metabacillus dongyingensis TaxID=2874282 RepID=UPI001FB46E93|nr:hypothetical protein [Metabacillus dongyingensis]UNJ81074.1 hypothetical protein [Metabacillus dongyingensis]